MSKKAFVGLLAALIVLALGWWFAGRGTERPAPAASVSSADPASDKTPAVSAKPLRWTAPAKDEAPEESPAASTAPSASISGRVKNNEGQPISGADVRLEIDRNDNWNDVVKSLDVKTGPDGRYRFTSLDTFGPCGLFASAEGFVMERDTLDLSPGKQARRVDFVLTPAAFHVSGRVVTETRQPVPGASVDVMYYGYDEKGLAHTAATGRTTGRISSFKFLFAVTDDSGNFTVAIPAEGLSDFRVTKEGFGPGFFPGIPTGTEDALFIMKAPGAISGKVTAADGTPLEGMQVFLEGTALPGGLEPSSVRMQELKGVPVTTTTGARGEYIAQGLGTDYVYVVAVPESKPSDVKPLPQEMGLQHIVPMMQESDEAAYGGKHYAARKEGVRVKAAQTTTGVDLVIDVPTAASLHGTVKDRTSGRPACPIVVKAVATGVDGRETGATAMTGLDGLYQMKIRGLTAPLHFIISCEYMTEGGNAWEQPSEGLAALDLGPKDNRELNLTVDAPVTVPVRYVDLRGSPLAGIEAAMRQAGGRGGCGGTLLSDAEGRVTFHGIPPLVNLQALAWQKVGHDLRTLGASDPFTGQPGETVSEVVVVCRFNGGVEGVLVRADSQAAANTEIAWDAQPEEGAPGPFEGSTTTGADGSFRIQDTLPSGTYVTLRVGYWDEQAGRGYSGSVQNVEVAADTLTNVGTVIASTEVDWKTIVEKGDYGTESGERIATLYTPKWLKDMAEPALFLKTGFALYDQKRYADALMVFERMSQNSDVGSIYQCIAMIWQGQMLDLLGRHQDAAAVYSAVAGMNVNERIRHDQYSLDYIPSEYAQERITEPFTRIENGQP